MKNKLDELTKNLPNQPRNDVPLTKFGLGFAGLSLAVIAALVNHGFG